MDAMNRGYYITAIISAIFLTGGVHVAPRCNTRLDVLRPCRFRGYCPFRRLPPGHPLLHRPPLPPGAGYCRCL
ncbi:MAG: hypothetical protein MZV70_30455 [Desulfobacterales bacterium]|nr:hypothetical protein [Desulfobacterales bacterium]